MDVDALQVLLVEDNPGDARLIREMLADVPAAAGWRLERAETLAEGIERLAVGDWSVALLDLSLPDADGMDTFRRFAHAASSLPIVVLSGMGDEAMAARAVAEGAQDYLVKGRVDGDTLARAVRYAVERQRVVEQLAGVVEREQELVRQLRDVDRMKDRFVAMAAHELRTPVTSISGFATTLLARWEDLDDADRIGFVGIIDEQSQRLTRLVEELLTLSRISAGTLIPHRERVDVAATLGEAIAELSDAEQVEVRCEAPLEAWVDAGHLRQVVLNFLTNAMRYGEPPYEVVACDSGEALEVKVSDHGPGVPDSFVPQLFEEFAQASNVQRQGSGLGLSIVRGLVRAHGGDAWYEPGDPDGATFRVRFPHGDDGAGGDRGPGSGSLERSA